MGYIKIGDEEIGNFSDEYLVNLMQDIKGGYKLRDETAAIWLAVLRSIDQQGPPMTVRGIFYNCENVWHVVKKTEGGYMAVAKQVLAMRRCGVLPYRFIADLTRWMRKPETWSGLVAYFEHGRRAYRRAIWDDQSDYVEIWAEKDAVAGILSTITEEWDVPLMVVRGYSSETFAYNAAEAIKDSGKPAWIYYFGDWDKHGLSISKDIERKLKGFGAIVNFERVAILPWQIEAYGLPTRPTKDAGFGDCVEIDALPANTLRKMARDVILAHIDKETYDQTLKVESLERETLTSITNNWGLV
jgi:hypothetical protein